MHSFYICSLRSTAVVLKWRPISESPEEHVSTQTAVPLALLVSRSVGDPGAHH